MYTSPAPNPTSPSAKAWTVPMLRSAKQDGRKLTMLTCYDAGFARAIDAAGVDLVLVGDSLGMVVQGRDSTLPVTVDDITYHTACVARGLSRALLVADLPFQITLQIRRHPIVIQQRIVHIEQKHRLNHSHAYPSHRQNNDLLTTTRAPLGNVLLSGRHPPRSSYANACFTASSSLAKPAATSRPKWMGNARRLRSAST